MNTVMKKIVHGIGIKLDNFLICNGEEKTLVRFLNKLNLPKNAKILDVACGYGRNMKLIMQNTQYEIEGVEINSHIVAINCQSGLDCCTVEDFHNKVVDNKLQYDCMIFSHIVEHFHLNELKDFLDFYLKFLKLGGAVIIATPLMWKGFYWDFDHIKPYHPIGINMVFGNNDAQVQYYAKTSLKLKDIWFGKIPYRAHYHRGLYIKSLSSYWWRIVNWCYAILFKVSFGVIGFYQSWMAVYIKEK